ncbi:unnamed protein product [Urochloa decumbens]|uniref:KIB1-4 beta-propeller domain-containing protein n=1 Tax=Urochloa decumbens TaxID=240449 RepID=A0ABC9AVB0_9POAL
MQPTPPSWSEIPLDLAGLVLGRLPTHADRVCFAAACRRWRAAARETPLPQPLPLLALPDGTMYSPPLPKPFHLPAAAGYVAACGNWLLFSGADSGCFLRNPMSNATVPLPALHRFRERYKGSNDGWSVVFNNTPKSLAVARLLLCLPHLVAAYTMLQGQAPIQRITVCQPGACSWWSVCMHDLPILAGMAFCNGTLFAVERRKGGLYAIDIGVDRSTGDPWVSRLREVIDDVPRGGLTSTVPSHGLIIELLFCLEESHGALLMVRRFMHYQWTQRGKLAASGWNEFEVFEADLQGSCWTKVATIGDDQVLFLSGDHCSSLCVSHLGIPGDRIVFFENDNEGRQYVDDSTSSCSVYDMRDGKISAFFPMALHRKRGTEWAAWLFPEKPSEVIITTST